MSLERAIAERLVKSRLYEMRDEEIEKVKSLVSEEEEVDDEEYEVDEKCEEEKEEDTMDTDIDEASLSGHMVRRVADEVLRKHGLNNSVGRYDAYVNKMYNIYRETLLDKDRLMAVLDKELLKFYPNLKEAEASCFNFHGYKVYKDHGEFIVKDKSDKVVYKTRDPKDAREWCLSHDICSKLREEEIESPSWTEEDMHKYHNHMVEEAKKISYQLNEEALKHPDYAEKFNELRSHIKEVF